MLIYQERSSLASRSTLTPLLNKWVSLFRTILATCRNYYAAACLYEEFSSLSDTELRRMGLSRDTLARDICIALDPHPSMTERQFQCVDVGEERT